MFHHPTIKWVCTLIALFFIQLSYSQTAVTDALIKDQYYAVSLSNDEGNYTLKIKKDETTLKEVSTPNFNPTFIFNQLLKALCLEKDPENEGCSPTDLELTEQTLKQKASELFIDLIYTYANEGEKKGQRIAEVTLNKDIHAYTYVKLDKENKKSNSFKCNDTVYNFSSSEVELKTIDRMLFPDKQYGVLTEKLSTKSCQLVFENGFIASIIVSGEINGKSVQFSSQYSIGITTRRNVLDLQKVRLWDELGNSEAFILLNEVIEYARINDVYTRDHSPQDGKLILNSQNASQAVYKSPQSKLFAVKVFSDFVGINENNPNGLVQIEIDKRINLWTRRVNKLSRMTFLNPYFEWSKIEEHNRTLPLSLVNNIQYTSPLEVYRYSMVETGVPINLTEYDGSVVGFQVNVLPAITFTNIADSTAQESNGSATMSERINSFMLGGELKFTFSPEKAWNFVISSRPFYYWNMNSSVRYNSILQKPDEQVLEAPNRWLNDVSIQVGIRLGQNYDNHFFARLGVIHELENLNNNFAQVQIGYATFFKTKGK